MIGKYQTDFERSLSVRWERCAPKPVSSIKEIPGAHEEGGTDQGRDLLKATQLTWGQKGV